MNYRYSIPKDIKDRIPEEFYGIFKEELEKRFGSPLFGEGEDGIVTVYYIESSIGWYSAFTMATNRANCRWLKEYYDDLDWEQGDLFDSEISEEMIERYQNGPVE